MNNLIAIVAAIKSKVFKLSGSKINQSERNTFKSDTLTALMADLNEIGSVHRTADGIILEVENDELGVVYLEFDVKVKDTEFNLDEAVADYTAKVEARSERVQLAAERKAKLASEKANKPAKTKPVKPAK